MQALIQRVSQAKVDVAGETIGAIDQGLLVLLGVEKHDDSALCQKLVNKVLGYRVFSDDAGKMNLSVKDIQGQVLVVSQFTLAADTKSGMRPSFSSAAPPEDGERLYQEFTQLVKAQLGDVATGQFGADMQVSLVNDGPVTFRLAV